MAIFTKQQLEKTVCLDCKKKYTKAMCMIVNQTYSLRLCIKCYNRRTNGKTT